ncbi:SAM-dependent methyltransferase [Bradyrhizobium sp. UFLA05-112]
MTLHNNYQLLERGLSPDEPRRLDDIPCGREHNGALTVTFPRDHNALEVGCAATHSRKREHPNCERLTVACVVPQAISRARQWRKRWTQFTWIVSDIRLFLEPFDLIVVADVLY